MGCIGTIPHAMLVPASGQGHANPCMLLARSLSALGFEVSFVYFSSEYAKLRDKEEVPHPAQVAAKGADPSSKNPASDSHHSGGSGESPPSGAAPGSIHIHVVQDGLSTDEFHGFFPCTNAMKENLFDLIMELQEQGTPLTCVISDAFVPWTIHVAKRAHIPLVHFWPSNAFGYVMFHGIPFLFSQGIFPEKGSSTQWKRDTPLMLNHIPGLPPFSSELYAKEVRFTDSSSPFVSLVDEITASVKQGERMLIHTMSELEPDAFHALQAMGINAYAVGPLLHHTKTHGSPVTASPQVKETLNLPNREITDCTAWLDAQDELSVIYVAFGSNVSLSPEEILELAYGLEACGNPFLWVIRESSNGGELPNGFLDRVGRKGMIRSWASQMEVLKHRAIGGFLTHCGWNSTFESLWAGVPMLCCPYGAEQRSNSHYICDVWGVGVELGRTDSGGLERRSVELGVRALMQEEEGGKARAKAKEVMQLCRKACQEGGHSFSNLQKFNEDMKTLCIQHPISAMRNGSGFAC